MNRITHIFKVIFDFFCGDWRIFWGIAVTCAFVELAAHLTTFIVAIPFSGIIYIIGISLSLVIALKREISK